MFLTAHNEKESLCGMAHDGSTLNGKGTCGRVQIPYDNLRYCETALHEFRYLSPCAPARTLCTSDVMRDFKTGGRVLGYLACGQVSMLLGPFGPLDDGRRAPAAAWPANPTAQSDATAALCCILIVYLP